MSRIELEDQTGDGEAGPQEILRRVAAGELKAKPGSDKNVMHVYPCYGQEHETDGEECWCKPRRDHVLSDDGELAGWVVVHREDN